MITAREQRYITRALATSLESSHKRIRIGAVLVNGNHVVSSAANQPTSHPLQAKWNKQAKRIAPAHSLHAEIHALVKSRQHDLTGTEIYVARLDRNGSMAMCRPCKACRLALVAAGIRTIIFTTSEGVKREHLY